MKKATLLFCMGLLIVGASHAQYRYLNEVFSGVNVTYNVLYGQNISVLTGVPDTVPLLCDIYEPAGDALPARPVVVYLHTGSFLPILINGTATGSMRDSAVAEMCRQFARRGYVAVSMDYRLGWNPIGATQDIRTGTLLQAVYRAIQDAKTCVRFLRMTAAAMGNPYRIDPNRIMLVGQGSGGYVVLAYITLDKSSEISLLKFLSSTTDATYGFVAGQPYVNQAILGDFEGFGGIPQFNIPNWPGYSSSVSMSVNLGGALGDSSWLEGGEPPVVCFHVIKDPFAPYSNGAVIVPTTGQFVVEVSGSREVARLANQKGNNSIFKTVTFNDPYTARANQLNEGFEGLFPFELIDPSLIIPGNPFKGQAGPWEWWDSLDLQKIAPFLGVSPQQATAAYLNGFLTNPDMSKQKALRYIDTIQNYIAPRAFLALDLDSILGIETIALRAPHIFPTPAQDGFTIRLKGAASDMNALEFFDLTGRLVHRIGNLSCSECYVPRNNLPSGLYFLKMYLRDGSRHYGQVLLQ